MVQLAVTGKKISEVSADIATLCRGEESCLAILVINLQTVSYIEFFQHAILLKQIKKTPT